MSETEHETPEAAALREARRQLSEDRDPDEMKTNILRLSRESNILEHGLTENRPVDDEPDEELVEAGKRRYEALKAERDAQPPPLDAEAKELYEQATERELRDLDGIEAGV